MSANLSGRSHPAANLRLYWHLSPPSETDGSEGARHGRPELVRERPPQLVGRTPDSVQIARAAGMSGFDGLVVSSDDSDIIAAAARAAPHLLLVPELPAPLASLVHVARQTLAFGRAPEQRPGWSVISNDGSVRQHRISGRPAADLAARTAELLRIARDMGRDPQSSFKGRFFEVEDGSFTAPRDRNLFPPIFLRGEQQAVLEIAARAADVHLFEPAPPEALRRHVAMLDDYAREEDRHVQFGVTARIIARETDAEAARAGPADLSGSYDSVAGQLASLCATGVSHVVLTSRPEVEEVHRIGRHVIPRLRARVLANAAARRLRA
jgi:alkanesulfonate monooxygenase